MSSKNTKGFLAIDVCAHCKKPASTKCGDCRISSYCSQRCQKFDRKQHCFFMQCLKDNKTEMKGENKIMFEEFLEAQALLSYAFFGTGIDFGINDLCVKEYIQRETKLLIPENCAIDIEITHKVALETKLFATYRGNFLLSKYMFWLTQGYIGRPFSNARSCSYQYR
ncbi:uncharacterized protein LOC130644549 isoform X2 [Hydractinia symbiolongicarpus]|uniref:uncharacterized protein LOC130644549 isoform X2 n=1 Tax=Hydractinia symbiolongicarpus TaxID=13093 RepID=UPI00254C4B61|nr:uncharacterized protein LOC130644549 isoform X2 [Hydractinia symbiolongicarpus]XP_057306189.1 uncharacterized protein LOC130644549 isoform X2 [Hydractinia symbiolongicarpus]